VKVFHFEHEYVLVQKVATVSHKYIGKKADQKYEEYDIKC